MLSYEIKPYKETGQHSYHRRSFHHDYHSPFIYHIILKKAKGCSSFGSVQGDARHAPGTPGCARIAEMPLGKIIAKATIHLPHEHPCIKLLQFCVMPDHVHLLVQILFKSDKHLDFYIEDLKEKIAAKFSKQKGSHHPHDSIFEPGYCDKPLYDNRSLDGLFRYIRENPHRLAMRRQFPQFFQRVRNLKIGDCEYEAYGNLFLYRNPDKEAVKISRKFTSQKVSELKATWLSDAAKGTVLVSPFISPKEKEIRAEAEALGGKIILIVHEALGECSKPAAHDFALCTQGRLLIISLGLPAATTLTRDTCQQMNALAQSLLNG